MAAGRQVSNAQVKEVRRNLHRGASLRQAAMKADMDRKTARKYRDLGQLPSEARTPHTWRTRPDPLAEVWPHLEELLGREPSLQAKTLLDWLEREHPGQDWPCHRRALGGRVRRGKARHRTDRMTLAVHHDGNGEQFTARYQALLRHYGLTGEATNPASGHENGDCEQSHRRFKEALEQALLLRGSRDFASREAYLEFVRALVARRNAARGVKFHEEVARLRPLPERRLETLERQRVKVGQGSTIRVKKNV